MACPGEDLRLAVSPLVLPSRVDALEEQALLHPERFQQLRYPPIAGGATPHWYVNGLLHCMNATINLATDNIKLMLVTSAYTPSQASDSFASAFSGAEATGGSGYPAGGFALSCTTTASALTVNWDASDISQAITSGPFAFEYGCFYKSRGGLMSANEAIGYVDFGAQSVTGATLTITLTNQLSITAS